MTRIATVLLALTCLFAAGSSAAQGWPDLRGGYPDVGGGGNDAALIVAIEDYAFVEDVPGARANGEDWFLWLTRARGVPVGSIRFLRDQEGTNHQILGDAERVAGQVGDGGTLWVVFIGHGAPSADGSDGLLVGVDAQQTAIGLAARSVARSGLLGAVEVGQQSRTVVVLDACFSGRTSTGGALVPGLQPLVPTYDLPSGSATVLSAARSDQFAGPLPGLGRPAFSYLLLGAFRGWGDADGDGLVTGREAVEYVQGVLFAVLSDRQQTPAVDGPGQDEVIAAGMEEGPDIAAMVVGASADRSSERVVQADESVGVERVDAGGAAVGIEAMAGYPTVAIEPGAFWMGSPEAEAGRDADETRHKVALTRSFVMGATEVSQHLYAAVMGTNPSRSRGDRLPVESVTWLDAIRFCNALSEREGLVPAYRVVGDAVTWDRAADGYRLPTEAEWEYAARAGTGRAFAGGDHASGVAWTRGTSGGTTNEVATLAPNAWGLYDMSGNVWEWTWDWYGHYDVGQSIDPSGPSDGSIRVIRGGSFDYDALAARVARRNGRETDRATGFLGFRIVASR